MIPNWPQDANDALELLKPTAYAIWFNGMEWEVQDITNGKAGDTGYYGYSIPIITYHESLGRAISIAWLRWQDAQAEDES
jgi:hypothetical protein